MEVEIQRVQHFTFKRMKDNIRIKVWYGSRDTKGSTLYIQENER